MKQQKFAYNVKSINFKRILSGVVTSMNEIYFTNAYNNKLIN